MTELSHNSWSQYIDFRVASNLIDTPFFIQIKGQLPPVDYSFCEERALEQYSRAANTATFKRIMPQLMNRFRFTEDDIIKEFLRYNLKINEETNDTYQRIGTQFALLINYLPSGTWFSSRLESYMDFINRFESIADVGFGIPFAWLQIAQGKMALPTKYILIDHSQSAIDFANEFIDIVYKLQPESKYMLQYSLQLGSIEDCSKWDICDAEAIVMLDCVEHAYQPQKSLREIAVKYKNKDFFIGLPVGTPIPQHIIDFDTSKDVENFVRGANLKIIKSNLVRANWDSDVVGNPGFQGSLFIEAK